MDTKAPFIYDSLDKPNAAQKSGETIRYRSDWRIVAVICFSLLIIAGLLIIVHNWAFYLIMYEIGWLATVGVIILVSMYTTVILALFSALGIFAFWGFNKARQAGLINVLDKQLTLDALNKLNLSDRMFDVAMERARQSRYKGVQTLTLDQSVSGIAQQPDLADVLEEKIENDGNPPLFEALQKDGLINRSGNSLLIGFRKDDD